MHELEPTWGLTVKVWWAYMWRNLIATISAFVIGLVVGFVVGLIFAKLGMPKDTIKPIVMILGFGIGLAISVVPMKLILGKDFGKFRLVLLETYQPLSALEKEKVPEAIA
jgi:ABC-type glycerol-3-phosphate transport system permease component